MRQTPTLSRGIRPNAWDAACALTLIRHNPMSAGYYGVPIDQGCNHVILHLERLGCETLFSCEGHPTGFYVVFSTSDAVARRVVGTSHNYVRVELDRRDRHYRLSVADVTSEGERIKVMRKVASAFDAAFGPLDLDLAASVATDKPFGDQGER